MPYVSIDMYHKTALFDFAVTCRIDKAKTRLGVKFYCGVCHKYILPDKLHKIVFVTYEDK